MKYMREDTITAIATPEGTGGIGIIRISGPDSKKILDSIFDIKKINPRELTYGHIKDGEKILDEVMVTYMPSPHTYTREDVVEINCHGGRVPMSLIMELILKNGARLAEPGEFTRRAFLNGRLDLSQAEAVIDVINAKTDASLDVAIQQIEGKFSEEIGDLRNALTDILVEISVNIDYPDEDIEELTYDKLIKDLSQVKERIENLLKGSKEGKILRDGLITVIAGRPNVGKSSLMNALLREDRAIVTEIPGTTRDTIEEYVNIKGIPIRLTDTAGIRTTEDVIEKIGIERSKESIKDADLIILLIDASENITDEDRKLREEFRDENLIIIFNKMDKGSAISEEDMKRFSSPSLFLKTSLKEKEDIKKIEEEIFKASGLGDKNNREGNLVTNVRHIAMLNSADQSITDGIKAAKEKAPLEVIEIDIASAYENLGFITGDSVQEDVIDQIFSRFCLGK